MPSFEHTLGIAQWIARQHGDAAPLFIVQHLGFAMLAKDQVAEGQWKEIAAAFILLKSSDADRSTAGSLEAHSGGTELDDAPSLSELRRQAAARGRD